jgi:predicted nuclease with TOPRIM domain
MKTEIIKNKDGSVTKITTYTEEETITADDVQANISALERRLKGYHSELEIVEEKFSLLKEQEYSKLKNQINSTQEELNSFS